MLLFDPQMFLVEGATLQFGLWHHREVQLSSGECTGGLSDDYMYDDDLVAFITSTSISPL